MRHGIVSLLCSGVALAQTPQRDPIQLLVSAYSDASSKGRLDEAATRRADARDLLKRASTDAPQFETWVGQVWSLYERASRSAEARAVLEDAIARAGNGQTAADLLNNLSSSWEQDGNLLRAVSCAEKAVAAAETAPAPRTEELVRFSRLSRGAVSSANANLYQRLASLYRRTGRKEDAAAVVARLRARAPNDWVLASMYDELGEPAAASQLYRTLADQAPDPWTRSEALQNLSSLYERHRQYSEGAAAMQQAIATGAGAESMWMQARLAHIQDLAGNTEAAAQAYRASVSSPDAPWNLLTGYAGFLANHQHADQAESLLNDYLANHPTLNPNERSQLYLSLANIAQQAGSGERAAAYHERFAQITQDTGRSAGQRDPFEQVQAALSHDDIEQAEALAFAALAAPNPRALETTANQAMQVVTQLYAHNQPARADQLYQAVVAAAGNWSVDTMRPLLDVLRQRADFLIAHQEWAYAEPAIDRYRAAVFAASGTDSGRAQDALHMAIRLDQGRKAWPRAIIEAQDLVANEARFNGTASSAYYHALETAAGVYEASGNLAAALPLVRRQVEVADQVFEAPQRACARVNASNVLARTGQFDEAERLAAEAAALVPSDAAQLDAIRRMKAGKTPTGFMACGFPGSVNP
jgi:hypothetical protein